MYLIRLKEANYIKKLGVVMSYFKFKGILKSKTCYLRRLNKFSLIFLYIPCEP